MGELNTGKYISFGDYFVEQFFLQDSLLVPNRRHTLSSLHKLPTFSQQLNLLPTLQQLLNEPKAMKQHMQLHLLLLQLSTHILLAHKW